MSAIPFARTALRAASRPTLLFGCIASTLLTWGAASAGAEDLFLPVDREDMTAAIRQCDPAGSRRIRVRLDGIIDEMKAALLAAQDEKINPKKREKRKPGKGDDRGKGGSDSLLSADLQARLTSAVAAWRLTQVARDLSPKEGSAFWKALEQSPTFAHTLAMTVDPERDTLSGVWQLATEIVATDAAMVDGHPELAAAICVVYDTGNVSLTVNENRGRSPEPDLVWKWYTSKADSMRFGIDLAPELLTLIVDVPAGIDEIGWAHKNFGGAKEIGPLYQQIEYDFESLKGKPKKSNVAGWNLPNILKHGGICADQAYFTTTVAKSLGIPAVYTIGQDSTTGHAWAGFVRMDGKKPVWDVSGRYDSYKGVTGVYRNPQTGQAQNDAVLAMLVQWGLEPKAERIASSILRVADERIETRVRDSERNAKLKVEDKDIEILSSSDIEALRELREALITASLRRCPTDVRSWFQLRDLGASGGLELSEMELWFGRITDLCGEKYPEMVLEVSAPLIKSLKETTDQHKLWLSLADYLSKRADLASQALIADGAMWEKASDDERAAKAYGLVLKRYPDAGPPTEAALAKLASMLERRDEPRSLAALYESVFTRMTPPKDMAKLFGKNSSWYRVGKKYVQALRGIGKKGEANALNDRIEAHVDDK
jgi:hypothetical protein